MTFDLSGVQKQAQEAQKQSQEYGNSKYRTVYTQSGTISLRVLFNPASGVVMRQVHRHKIGKDNIACLSNYNQDCPICKAVDEAETVTGGDLWRMKKSNRCIFFAQYVGSTYSGWTENFPEPKVGDVILMMAPWSVYSALNSLIAESGDNVTKLLTDVEGMIVDIKREDGGRITYSTGLKPFAAPFKSANSQEEFNSLLESLDNLNDLVVPQNISEDIINAANQAATAIRGEYVSPRVMGSSGVGNGSNLGQVVGAQTQSQPNVWDSYQQQSSTVQPQPSPQPSTQQSTQPSPQQSTQASGTDTSGLLPSNGDRKVNPVTGQVFVYNNGQWTPTGETESTTMNGGLNG